LVEQTRRRIQSETLPLFDILSRVQSGEWTVEFPLIVSNHPDVCAVAEKFGIPAEVFPITPETRDVQEEQPLALLRRHRNDFVALARAIWHHLQNQILVYNNKTVIFD
jgi:formyltetrahydrofolate deformylase